MTKANENQDRKDEKYKLRGKQVACAKEKLQSINKRTLGYKEDVVNLIKSINILADKQNFQEKETGELKKLITVLSDLLSIIKKITVFIGTCVFIFLIIYLIDFLIYWFK